MKRKSRAIPLGLTAVLLMALSLFTAQPAMAATKYVYATSNITCSSINTGGDDLVLVSQGTITINGDVNTGSGTMLIGAGVGFNVSGTETPYGPCSGAKEVASVFNITDTGGQDLTITNGDLRTSGSANVDLYADHINLTGGTINVAGRLIIHSGSLNATVDDSVNVGQDIFNVAGRVVIKALDDTSHKIEVGLGVTAPGNTIILASKGNIKIGAGVSNAKSDNVTDIRIFANHGATGATDAFVIGSASDNGVATVITNTSETGALDFNTTRGIYVSNGGTGGITVVNGNKINPGATQTRAASIGFNANNGDVRLQGGTLQSNGTSTYPSGLIAIWGEKAVFSNGAAVEVTDSASQAVTHYIAISANEINYTGGLTLTVNGPHHTDPLGGVVLGPKGSQSVTAPLDPDQTLIYGLYTPVRAPLTIGGTGSSGKLTVNGFGANSRFSVSGYPVTFNGGDVDIVQTGSNVLSQFTFTGDAQGNTSLNFAGGAVRVFADNTNGNAGNVWINADKIVVGSSTSVFLSARALGGTGNGGNVEILYYDGNVNLGSGNGAIRAEVTSNTNPGDGGLIHVNGYQATSQVTLHSSFVADSLNATPTGTNGKGGELRFLAGSLINSTGGNPTLRAEGKGNRDGGKIDLTFASSIEISAFTSISAKGGDQGNGGEVIVLWAAGTGGNPIDQSKINVNAGDQSGTEDTDFHGRVTLNGRTCRQWKTGQSSWPKSYWNCVNPESNSVALDKVPVDLAMSATFNSLRTLLGNQNVEIHVFAGHSGYNAFFGENRTAIEGGITFKLGDRIYTNPWQSGSIGDPRNPQGVVNPYSTSQYKEVAAHELGHAVDEMFKVSQGTLPSRTTTYDTWLLRDINTLNYADAGFTVNRVPCRATPGYSQTAPFSGVVDVQSGKPVCVLDIQTQQMVLNPELFPGPGVPPNDQILLSLEQGLWNSTLQGFVKWVEAHAQLFGYKAVGNIGARPMNDKIADNGYFPCLQSWANSELGGSTPTGSCTLAP